MSRRVLKLAIPNIISNITIPLLSLVDIGLAGRMETTESIGAVTVAGSVMSLVFWLFGFLRMNATGFTAQAYGRSDVKDITLQLVRGLVIAISISLVIIALRPWLYSAGYVLSAGQNSISADAQSYLSVAFLGAPAALMLYVLNGWLVGLQNTKTPMWIAILMNVLNIAISAYLVVEQQMGVRGLAIGTVLAQYIAVLLLLTIVVFRYKRLLRFTPWKEVFRKHGQKAYFRVGGQFFLRTAMLSSVTVFFTYASARHGSVALAANALLLQFFNLFSYFMDGFAYAGEALTGRYVGEKSKRHIREMLRAIFRIGWTLAIPATLLILLFPTPILHLLTDKQEVIAYASTLAPWAAFITVTGFAAFLWDGIYVGATAARAMLEAMILATIVFFSVYYLTEPSMGINGLWLAFNLYLLVRSVYSALRAKTIPFFQ